MHLDIDHVIVTRFNLPSAGFESFIRAKEGWLRDRIGLFERYCLPSVQAQTSQAFRWIIYFDPASPEWLKSRIEDHVKDKAYVPIFRESVGVAELIDDLRTVTGANAARLLTTNLDNDDALAVDFVERLQNAMPTAGRAAIYLAVGLIKSDSHLYRRLEKDNAFVSVAEDWTSPSTCWADWHNQLAKRMPTLEVYGEPAWLQVVHGGNVTNRVRGRMVFPARYTQLFHGPLDDMDKPRRMELVIDRCVSQPKRLVRDTGRVLLKRVALRLFGRDFLEGAKKYWISRTGRKVLGYSRQVAATTRPA